MSFLCMSRLGWAQSDDLRPFPSKDGWTRYEGEFKIEIPPLFNTVFQDNTGWVFLSRDSVQQTALMHDILLRVQCYSCAKTSDVDDVKLAKAWKNYRATMTNLLKEPGDTVIKKSLQSKKCEILTASKSGDTISYWYQQGIQHKGYVYTLIAQFDSRDKDYMDVALPRIAASFH